MSAPDLRICDRPGRLGDAIAAWIANRLASGLELRRVGFPRLEWTPCSKVPDDGRRVMVWHRAHLYCRVFRVCIGTWNAGARRWEREDSNPLHRGIYQPYLWRDLDGPTVDQVAAVSIECAQALPPTDCFNEECSSHRPGNRCEFSWCEGCTKRVIGPRVARGEAL